MTTLREAAQQALEALALWSTGRDMDAVELNDLIFRLEAALAEPVQEPYAWMAVGGSIWRHKTSEDDVPLYTAPPQRKPLTDEEIAEMWVGIFYDTPSSGVHVDGLVPHRFARAIERAHGIK